VKELLFLQKKKQKNSWPASRGVGTMAGQHGAKRNKSFLVLFFKKELLAFTERSLA
jgi:hypothetical protein